jgi:hypothetical protein
MTRWLLAVLLAVLLARWSSTVVHQSHVLVIPARTAPTVVTARAVATCQDWVVVVTCVVDVWQEVTPGVGP